MSPPPPPNPPPKTPAKPPRRSARSKAVSDTGKGRAAISSGLTIDAGDTLTRHLAEGPLVPVYLVTSAEPPSDGGRARSDAPPSADPQALQRATRAIELAAMAGGDPSMDHVRVDYIDGDHQAAGIHTVIVGEARSVSLFGGRRVVTVTHADTLEYGGAKAEGRTRKKASASQIDPLQRLIEGLPTSGPPPFVLIFVAERFKRSEKAFKHLASVGAVVAVAALDPRKLQSYLEEEALRFNIQVERGVAQRIWDRLGGGDGARLRQTADRLLLDVGPGGKLGVRTVEEVVPMDREAAVWAITDAVTDGDVARCFGVLHLLLQQGTAALGMVGFLASHYRAMMQVQAAVNAGHDRSGVAKATGVHPFRVSKMMGQLRGMRPGRLEQAVANLAEADVVLKASTLGGDASARWMEQLLLCLAHGKPVRMARDQRAQATL